MKQLRTILFAGLLSLSGCSNQEIFFPGLERITEKQVIEVMNSKEKAPYAGLYCNPLQAYIGQFKGKIDSKELINGVIDGEALVRSKVIDRSAFFEYADIPGQRGDDIYSKLEKQIKDEKMENSLLIVFAGAGHMTRLGERLGQRFNCYYFSEESYIMSLEETKKEIGFDMMRFYYYKPRNRNKEGRPEAIIFGNAHNYTSDFVKFMPTVEEMKKRGVKRIIFGAEHYVPGKDWEISDLRKHRYKSYEKFADYLEDMKKQGFDVKVLGLEPLGVTILNDGAVMDLRVYDNGKIEIKSKD